MRALQKRIAFLSIFEIGYCALGRGDAERSECSPFWRVPSLTNVACRVAIKATALRLMAPGSRCDTQWHPRKRPTVGAGSSRFSRRFPRPPDSPYAKIPPPTVPAAQTLPPPRPLHHTPSRESCIRGFKIRPQACAHATCGLFPIPGLPGALPSRRGAGDRGATNDTSARRSAPRRY